MPLFPALNAIINSSPPKPPTPEVEVEIIPKIVDKNKIYKLNKDLTEEQIKNLLN